MKRFLIVFVTIIALLAFFSLASAIDRAPKDDKAKEKEEPAKLKEYDKTDVNEGKVENSAKGGAEGEIAPEKKGEGIKKQTQEGDKTKGTVPNKLTKWLKSLDKQKAEEKYDYFIDKNNNGIDDRLEIKSKEPVSPPAIRPVPKKEQPVKPAPSTKKTDEKKKEREAPKEKEAKRQRR
jgi:hypothetical protein